MACSDPQLAKGKSVAVYAAPRKPRILLAACGCVAAVKFGVICRCFSQWAEVKAIVTRASQHFIDKQSIPNDVAVYFDEHEWFSWKRIGDIVLHIELCRWAEMMVIAPLSADTLAKVIKLIIFPYFPYVVCA